MAIKKSELYSSLWASCDELRGGMDASQYKDYVLVLLFIKYVSDKFAGQAYAPIQIPAGASFSDMVAMKGKTDIGDRINKHVLRPLEEANKIRFKADFNDAALLGQGKEMVEKLGNLIAIFENPALDFSKNRADGDDILGDAYEYLMRHFATESGKSKGQFYTPAEVSRVMAQVIGIHEAKTTPNTTVYDPTCGSGSLLLKVADAARTAVTLYGQEKDEATSGLAQMNMVLHNNPSALISQGNTLADPKHLDGDALKTFDYVVANPPFSDKRWSTGLTVGEDKFKRFDGFGIPPAKQGDYAYLLHIIRSLKPNGKAACILPHGVLFRGNAEAEIRKNLVRRGYIKGVIGLPANLFFGTGIPACIIVIDKQGAQARRGIFMVDASQGFIKEGPKNRLREQDIHRIVDTFTKQEVDDPIYARLVSLAEIEKNDFNLNLPRYLESRQTEDMQDIEGHLKGGIPLADVDALQAYWATCPQLRATLFSPLRPGYLALAVDKAAIKPSIHQHPEFVAYTARMAAHFEAWRSRTSQRLKKLAPGFKPKALIVELAEDLLAHYQGQPLLDAYDVYQRLMDQWSSTWQDDAYLLTADGWTATTYRVIETRKGKDGKPGKQVDKGWACDLVPKATLVARYCTKEQALMTEMSAQLDAMAAQLAELEEEHGGEDGAFAELDKVNKANVTARMKEIQRDANAADEASVLRQWLKLSDEEAQLKKALKDLDAHVDQLAHDHYPRLSEAEIQTLVVDDKWLAALGTAVHAELDGLTQSLTQRVKELADRYEATLPEMVKLVDGLQDKITLHLASMGFWNHQVMQGGMQKPITNQQHSPAFSGKWTTFTLGDLGLVYGGLSGKTKKDFGHGSAFYIPFMNVMTSVAINPEWLELVDVKSNETQNNVKQGDLLFNGSSETPEEVGMCSVLRHNLPNLYLNSFCFGFRLLPNAPADGNFMAYWFRSAVGRSTMAVLAQGATRYNIAKRAFVRLSLNLPTREEQTVIATVLSDMDAEITALEARLTKARHLKQGVAQALLTGRIRLM